MKEREINAYLLILIILTVLQTILSFFPCYLELTHNSLDDGVFEPLGIYGPSWDYTDSFIDNAKWLVLPLSLIEVMLFLFNKKWIRIIRTGISCILISITLCYPIYLYARLPEFDGSLDYRYNRTVCGYIVLILEILMLVGSIIYNRQVKKEQNRS